jgi:septal ring factor EnvC (AmiA/AmiB activator)
MTDRCSLCGTPLQPGSMGWKNVGVVADPQLVCLACQTKEEAVESLQHDLDLRERQRDEAQKQLAETTRRIAEIKRQIAELDTKTAQCQVVDSRRGRCRLRAEHTAPHEYT